MPKNHMNYSLKLESRKSSNKNNLFLQLDLLQNSNSAKIISGQYCTSAKMISLSHINFALLQKVVFAMSN